MNATACGYVDGLGYLYCADCAAKYEKPVNRPVYSDQSAHVDEQCDGPGCKRIIGNVNGARAMQKFLDELAEPGGIYALVELKGRRYFIGQGVNYKQIEDMLAEYLKTSGVCAFATDRRGSMSINGLKEDLDRVL